MGTDLRASNREIWVEDIQFMWCTCPGVLLSNCLRVPIGQLPVFPQVLGTRKQIMYCVNELTINMLRSLYVLHKIAFEITFFLVIKQK